MSINKEKRTGKPLEYNKIDRAKRDLYDSWNWISEYTTEVLKAKGMDIFMNDFISRK